MDANIEISVKEVAEKIGKSQQFVRYAVMNGSLPGAYTKIGKRANFFIPRTAFEKFLTEFVRQEKVDAATSTTD